MQSVASLMSIGKSDIGNLEDIEDEESDVNLSAKFAEVTSQMAALEMSHNSGNPFGDPDDEDVDVDIGIVPAFLLSFCLLIRDEMLLCFGDREFLRRVEVVHCIYSFEF